MQRISIIDKCILTGRTRLFEGCFGEVGGVIWMAGRVDRVIGREILTSVDALESTVPSLLLLAPEPHRRALHRSARDHNYHSLRELR